MKIPDDYDHPYTEDELEADLLEDQRTNRKAG